MRSSAVSALALASLLIASPGAASPLADPTAGRAVFTGPVSSHPTSLELNPSALALGLPGWHVYLSGSGTLDQIGIDRKTVDPEARTLLDGPSVSTLTGSWGASSSLWGVFPSGLISSVGLSVASAPAERYPSGEDALRYHSLGGGYRELSVTIGGSIRLGSVFHLGAMFGLVPYSSLDLSFARDTALAGGREGLASDCLGAPCGLENPAADEIYRIDDAGGLRLFNADRIILSIGTLIQVYPDWWLGLSYRSPQGLGAALTLSGDLTVQRAANDPEGPGVMTGDVDVKIDLPHTFHAGLRGRLRPTLDLVIGLRFENLSRLSQFDVRPLGGDLAGVPEWLPRPRGLRNVLAGTAGVEQVDVGQRVVFGGRLGAETAAVSAQRISPMQVSGLVLTADAGVQVRLLPTLVLQISYGAGYYPEVDSSHSKYDPLAMIDCIDRDYNYEDAACEAVRSGYAIPTAAGRYRRLSHASRLGLRYDF